MRHYQVRDVMTAGPVTATPATPLKDVASMLVRRGIGAVPVVTPQLSYAVDDTRLPRSAGV